jgi:hypothetical protein
VAGVNPQTRLSFEYVVDPFDLPIQLSVVEEHWSSASQGWELFSVRVFPIEAVDSSDRQWLEALRSRWQQPRLL